MPLHPVTLDALGRDVVIRGRGEHLLVLQTALDVDELEPLADRLARRGDLAVVSYPRRGYGGSGPPYGEGSVASEVEDCLAVLDALGVSRCHVTGVSFSAAIALALAATAPERLCSVTVVEAPPPRSAPSSASFREANQRLLAEYRTHGPESALDAFMTILLGRHWRSVSERSQPGSVAALERDATAFFVSDVPALLDWDFGPRDAARVTCPVLYVGGSDSAPWFVDAREHLLRLLPQAQQVTIPGAGHLLATTHCASLADAISRFLVGASDAEQSGDPPSPRGCHR